MPLERLQKIIASTGALSRRAAEEAITQGRVSLNGRVITELGTQADRQVDQIQLDGRKLLLNPKLVSVVLHKPPQVMCTREDPQKRKTVLDLLPPELQHLRPVGRLDFESEGLLFLTNDGDLHQRIAHPSHGIQKIYSATVQGVLSSDDLRALTTSIALEDGPGKFDSIILEESSSPSSSRFRVCVSEGRNRFVRRMFSAIGHGVTRLVRVQVGGFPLGELGVGHSRVLTESDLQKIFSIGDSQEPPLPARARYFPLDKPLYEVAPGLKTWATDLGNGEADSKIFQIDSDFSLYRANKLTARSEQLSKYHCETAAMESLRADVAKFLVERMTHEHPSFFSWTPHAGGGGSLSCRLTRETLVFDSGFEFDREQSKTTVEPAYQNSLDALLCQVQEDLGVVLGGNPSDELVALHLCSPSHWAAEDKIGKHFFAIHEPIPGVEKLNRAAKAIVDAMIHKGPYVRFVWGFATDRRLNHHPAPAPGVDSATWHGRSFSSQREPSPFLMRLERQVVWGLPKLNSSLFFIRVYFIEGREIRAKTTEKDLLAGAIRSMNPASLQYKGLDRCKEEVLNWLSAAD